MLPSFCVKIHECLVVAINSLALGTKPRNPKESLVSGLTFLHEHKPNKEVFKIQPDGTQEFVDWPDPMYPCIVVNIGSGALSTSVVF